MGILDGVGQIEIKECGEDLAFLENEFVLEPMYFTWGYTKTADMSLRSGVLKKLRLAQQILRDMEERENWNIKIWDGFRTLATQKILYDKYYSELEIEHPDWSDQELSAATEVFVSPASHDPKLPSPHNTGGAIDLTLVNGEGLELDMGTDFDEFDEKSFTAHFLKSDGEIHKNRMLLKDVMRRAGFVNYPEEWWHFSFGDQIWAAETGAKHAIYGSKEL